MQACDRVPPTARAKRRWCSVPTSVLPAIKAARARYGIASPYAVAIDADAEDKTTRMPAGMDERKRRAKELRNSLSDEGKRARLNTFQNGGAWRFGSHVELPAILNWPSSQLVAWPAPCSPDFPISPMFFVGKLRSSDATTDIWMPKDTVLLCMYGTTNEAGQIWKHEQRFSEQEVVENKVTGAFSGEDDGRYVFTSGTTIVLRCSLRLSGRSRSLSLYKLPFVIKMAERQVTHWNNEVMDSLKPRYESTVTWLNDVQSALGRGSELPVAPSVLSTLLHSRQTQGYVPFHEKLKLLRTMGKAPSGHSTKEYKIAKQVRTQLLKLNNADRNALQLPPWWGDFEQKSLDYAPFKNFLSLSTKERVQAVVYFMANKSFDENEKKRVNCESVWGDLVVKFSFDGFLEAALRACKETITPDYEPFAKAYPEFEKRLKEHRFKALAKTMGADKFLQCRLDALCNSWPGSHCYDGPRQHDKFKVELKVDGKTETREYDPLKFVGRLHDANWIGKHRLRVAKKGQTTEKIVEDGYILTHAQKQQLLRLPWFKFGLEVKAYSLSIDIDTALDADSLAILENGSNLRAEKLSRLCSRVDWKKPLSKQQQYMQFLGNHAVCWSFFGGEYGKGLKERVRQYLKEHSDGKKVAKLYADSIGFTVGKMWDTHDIDHIWVQSNRGDVADCIGNFALCPRVLNNSDEFKHDSPEKHHYYGVKTWEQVKMLFKMYDVWAGGNKNKSFNPNDVCKLVAYAVTPPHSQTTSIRSITDYFKPK